MNAGHCLDSRDLKSNDEGSPRDKKINKPLGIGDRETNRAPAYTAIEERSFMTTPKHQ